MRQWGVCTKSKVKSRNIISSFFVITSIIYKNWLNYWNNFRNIRALQVAYHASFASIIYQTLLSRGTPSSSLAYWWLLNFESTTLTPTKFSDMLRTNNYFVFNRLDDGWNENVYRYFRHHVPNGDDNTGRFKSWR